MFFSEKMTESYEIYVGNLDANTPNKKLKDLFSEIGNVSSVWINPKYKPVTYAFIGFDDLETANDACKRFDNYELNFLKLKVRKSFKTISLKPEKGILLELKKKKSMSKSHLLKVILNKNLRQNRDIVEDFKVACKEMEYLTDANQCEIIKCNPEPCTLATLEETVVRNYKMPRQKKQIPIDFDLTKGKTLTNEQYNKYFKTQLSMPSQQQQRQQQQQQQQTEAPKREKRYALDYRAVCD